MIDQSRLFAGMGSRRDSAKASEKLTKAARFFNKEKSRRHEERIAEALKGYTQPASGALPGLKSDVVSSKFKVECKTTQNSSLSIKAEWLQKIDYEAQTSGLRPALAIRFERMPVSVGKDWVVISLDSLVELIAAAKKVQEAL